MDTVEIRVHPFNFQRVIRDAQERGARVSRGADGRYSIDEIPVILDSWIDVDDKRVGIVTIDDLADIATGGDPVFDLRFAEEHRGPRSRCSGTP